VPIEGGHPNDSVVEVVYYPQTKALCVQGHPEYMTPDSEGWQWYQSLLAKYIFND
jgi:gamma-glutamyl-gamma-aminobutyrate hydrolase PuuD